LAVLQQCNSFASVGSFAAVQQLCVSWQFCSSATALHQLAGHVASISVQLLPRGKFAGGRYAPQCQH
jgi:hypothetical protein